MEQAPLTVLSCLSIMPGCCCYRGGKRAAPELCGFELLLVDDGSTDGVLRWPMNWPKKMAASGCWNSPMRASALRATLACSIAAASGSPFVMMMIPAAPCVGNPAGPCQINRGGCGARWLPLAAGQAAGTAVELPHPPGQAIIIHRPAGQATCILQQSGPQFVWNAMYCTNRLGHLRFDETCRKGLEDFAFNAAVFQQADSAAYTPQIVYEHLEPQEQYLRLWEPGSSAGTAAIPAPVGAGGIYRSPRLCPPQQLPKV